MPRSEGRIRFAQYGVLRAIAAVPSLQQLLVFKGGNALDFVWLPNRSTRDLDFSADAGLLPAPFAANDVKSLLLQGLTVVGRDLEIDFAIHRVEQRPPGADKTFIAYHANIQYALGDEQSLRVRLRSGEIIRQSVPVEISLNEVIREAEEVAIDDLRRLRVSTTEDIVSEKLRALLQQTLRNRHRPQDVLDIAMIVRDRPGLDTDRIATYLMRKAMARNVPVSRAAFHAEEIKERAKQAYAELAPTTRKPFLPFDEAWADLQRFVGRLALPVT